jgi:hypothetical protein
MNLILVVIHILLIFDDGTEEGDLEVEESVDMRGEIQKQKHFHQ